jgi:hypothetical protein
MTAKSQVELPVVVGKTYDFSVWLIQKVEHMFRLSLEIERAFCR